MLFEAAGDFHHQTMRQPFRKFTSDTSAVSTHRQEPLGRTARNMTSNAVYETMSGPNDFVVIGNLKDWDRIDRLGEITCLLLAQPRDGPNPSPFGRWPLFGIPHTTGGVIRHAASLYGLGEVILEVKRQQVTKHGGERNEHAGIH